MKKRLKYGNIKALKGIVIMMCAVLFLLAQKSTVLADATGKVTAPSAKIRAAADINSEVIASSESGKTVSITAKVTDASGTLWYEVYVDANTKGYIRSDLVKMDEASGTVPSKSAGDTAAQNTGSTDTTIQSTNTHNTTESSEQGAAAGTASGAETPAESEMPAQYASVKVPAAKIRSSASTGSGIVDTIPQNTQVIVSGQTNGSDGQIWYYVTFTGTGGSEKTGYVRNDLIELGEVIQTEEIETDGSQTDLEQDEASEENEKKDYEVVYEETEEGGDWYLYNNLENKKQKLEELLEAANVQEENDAIDASVITKQRIAIVVLFAIIVLMALGMTLMLFKLRDVYYEADEDEDDDELSSESGRSQKGEKAESISRAGKAVRPGKSTYEKTNENKRNDEYTGKSEVRSRSQTQAPVRKKTAEADKRMPVKEVTYEEEPENQIKPAPKKKARNFMLDDEEFEFEFLNMKNKDMD